MTTSWEIANDVQKAVEAEMAPGGALYTDLSDLLSRASGVAMDAAGVPVIDDRGTFWDWRPDAVETQIGTAIAEVFFRIANRNAKTDDQAAPLA